MCDLSYRRCGVKFRNLQKIGLFRLNFRVLYNIVYAEFFLLRIKCENLKL